MTARTNANPGVEIKADSTGYPDEVKRSYRETFFTRHNLKPYKYVGCTMSLWQRLKRIVTNIGGERASVGMYVQNIVAYHLEDEDVKPLIAELSAASCLSDTDSKAMDGISLEAKKYQAKYLMGDMVNRKEREIYISCELGKRLKRIVLDSGRPAQRVSEPKRSTPCGNTATRGYTSRSTSVNGYGGKRI